MKAIAAQVAKYGSLVADRGTVDRSASGAPVGLSINYRNDGYYVLMNFTAEPSLRPNRAQFRNDENVMRFIYTQR